MVQQSNEEDRMRIILKAQGLHKFAKMAVNIGKPNFGMIVKLTRYTHSLARPKNYSFLGIDKPIEFMDKDTVDKVMFDPIFGFRWYYQEQGELDIFGEQLLKAQGDVPLGTASEVAAVIPKGKGQMPDVITKQELGMDSRSTAELLKEYNVLDFHVPKEEPPEIKNRVKVEEKKGLRLRPPWMD